MTRITRLLLLILLIAPVALAQNRGEDEHTRYELLAPETNAFRISYDVTVVSAGAQHYFLPVRRTAHAADETVIDLMTGAPLRFREITGAEARTAGLADAEADTQYMEINLARPVPPGGETRIRVGKTYTDARSYYRDGNDIVFNRSLAVRRNAVVLPKGYELLAANLPVQVLEEPDGRLSASFMNMYPGEISLVIRAGPLKAARPAAAAGSAPAVAAADPAPRAQAMNQIHVSERAFQDREIVYFLKQPETHAFSLYHDYTASQPGEHQYVNVVRAGSSVSDPSATVLDTGETLKTRTLTGADVAREHIDIPDRLEPDTQVVLIPFPAIKRGGSLRLRISETYTDAARYALIDGQLMWHRSFGRPRNDIVLPEGWYLTTSSIPAVITRESDGRIRLSFWNPRPDNLDVFVKARRR